MFINRIFGNFLIGFTEMHFPESEFIERSALEDLHAAAEAEDIEELGLTSLTLAGAFCSIASRLPASAIVINRCLGLGLGMDASEDEIHALISAYRDKATKRYFVQIHPDHRPADIGAWLTSSGLKLSRGWQKFSRGRDPVVARKGDLSVREIGSEHGREFAEIVCNAFDIGANAVNWLSKIPGRPNWHIFMSFCDSEPAGVGALYVKDGFGWTDFGATVPKHRKKGSQSLLMQARLTKGLDLGCERLFTCTGVSTPGDPQHSYSNILRAGFVENYVRENYEPA